MDEPKPFIELMWDKYNYQLEFNFTKALLQNLDHEEIFEIDGSNLCS